MGRGIKTGAKAVGNSVVTAARATYRCFDGLHATCTTIAGGAVVGAAVTVGVGALCVASAGVGCAAAATIAGGVAGGAVGGGLACPTGTSVTRCALVGGAVGGITAGALHGASHLVRSAISRAGRSGAARAGGRIAGDAIDDTLRGTAPQTALSRLPQYAGGKTQGILQIGSKEVDLISGYAGPAAQISKGTPGFNNLVRSHVEAHASALMRMEGATEASLFINRIPCSGATGCAAMLSRMLPEGARLTVYGPDDFMQVFRGLPD